MAREQDDGEKVEGGVEDAGDALGAAEGAVRVDRLQAVVVDGEIEGAEEGHQTPIEDVSGERQQEERPRAVRGVETGAGEKVAERVGEDRGAEAARAAVGGWKGSTGRAVKMRDDLINLDADRDENERHGGTSKNQFFVFLLVTRATTELAA